MSKKISEYLKLNVFTGDKGVWMIFFLLCMISLVAIYSASSALTFKGGNHWDPVVRQAGMLTGGFFIVLLVSRIPCNYFKVFPIILMPIVIVLLIYILSQKSVNEASRWMSLFGVNFQPSEAAKTTLILYVALVLSKSQKEERVKSRKGKLRTTVTATKGGYYKPFLRIMIPTAVICGLIASENFSTAGMLFIIILIMMFIGNIPRKIFFQTLAGMAILGALFFVYLLITPYDSLPNIKRIRTWKHRIETKVNDEEKKTSETDFYSADANRQTYHSHIAIANSNLVGRGVGNSVERDFLPHAESDFIFSIIIEETGIFGATIVILLYIALLVRVGRIAQRCGLFFPAFLSIGLGSMMVFQALVNMAVAVGWAPVTGQTLPLISHGGTSILIISFNFGLILSVSRHAEAVQKKLKEETEAPAEAPALATEALA